MSVTRTRPLVLHLVWGPLGAQALREFLDAYHAHTAGVEHDLLIVLNGVGVGQTDPRAHRQTLLAELAGIEHRLIELPQPVLDLVAYGQALRAVDDERVCILNSHSRIRCDGWLAKLNDAFAEDRVGIVGASGSWAGMRSYAQFHLRLPNAYARIWPDRATTLREFAELAGEREAHLAGEREATPPARGLRERVNTMRVLAGMMAYCPAFPSPHLRTNAIMAERDLLVQLLPRRLSRKLGAYRLESAAGGLTGQIQRKGLRTLVVDRYGRSYEPKDWPDSETFWQGTQSGLLVADNQSDAYQRGDLERRSVLSRFAWGERAAPL